MSNSFKRLAGAGGVGGAAVNPNLWDITKYYYTYYSVASEETTPRGLFFKPDGTKMYVVGTTGDDINEYSLSQAGMVGSASFIQTFSVASEDTTPTGVFFKPDGTIMYVVGDAGNDVNQYDLSSAWDISTATANQTFSVASEEITPTGLFFKPDGTIMYVVGDTGNDVNQYDLSSAWDISTATANQAFSVAGQETTPTGVFFKPDGTIMYVAGDTGDDVNQYDLSTAWDISTATANQTFSVAGQETNIQAIYFTDDGTKMYIIGYNSDSVHEYILSTPWDISTATTQFFSVTSESTTPAGLSFKPDGTKMYMVESTGVNEYALNTAWKLSTASFTQVFNTGGQQGNAFDLDFNSEGTKMFIIGTTGDEITEYSLSTPWDISTASFVSESPFLAGIDGLTFGNSGNNIYYTDTTSTIYQQSLRTSWTIPRKLLITGDESSPEGLFFKSDGTKMFVVGTSGDDINDYDLSTPWDISTATANQTFSVATESASPSGLFFKSDGTKMFVAAFNVDEVNDYDLSTAWDISTATANQAFSVATEEGTPRGVFFKPDGTKMFIVGDLGDEVNDYDLSTAWDISTATANQAFSVAAQEATPRGLFFKSDGTKMYIVGTTGDDINEYALSTPWDISTASFTTTGWVGISDLADLYIHPDGNIIFTLNSSYDSVEEFPLETAWDASSTRKSINVSGDTTNIKSIGFKPDGTKMYTVDESTDTIKEFDLSQAWDVTTATYANSSVSAPLGLFSSIYIHPDGEYIYTINQPSDIAVALQVVPNA